ncbi:chemotaxis protein methyltransferase CheR [Bacillus sp. JCM 19045]|nr:chemotaxis protein methyltransferase CheR [Bacillus sp. JCM 19045]
MEDGQLINSIEEDSYEQFTRLFSKLTGIELESYKRPQMERRLLSLAKKNGHSSLLSFGKAMKTDKVLLAECLEKMTINVTSFFRNSERWQTLVEQILPKLTSGQDSLKIWSAACSTGEEAYTLAIICAEHNISLQQSTLLASDLDASILEKARIAKYKKDAVINVSPGMLTTYFNYKSDEYAVKESLRKQISFTQRDLLSDSYPDGCDLIVCRNVCIYFTEEAKQLIFLKLSQALRPGGILFVGSTEQIFNPAQFGLKPVASFFYEKFDLKK